MSDFLKLHYTLSEEIWRKFFEAHYARDHSLQLRYWFGALMILVGAMGLGAGTPIRSSPSVSCCSVFTASCQNTFSPSSL